MNILFNQLGLSVSQLQSLNSIGLNTATTSSFAGSVLETIDEESESSDHSGIGILTRSPSTRFDEKIFFSHLFICHLALFLTFFSFYPFLVIFISIYLVPKY